MTLQFQPPPEWLVNEYMNRKNPVDVASEGAKNMLGTYIAMKNQENTSQMAASKNLIDLMAQDPELLNTPLGQALQKQSGGMIGNYKAPTLTNDPTSPSVIQTTPSPDLTQVDGVGMTPMEMQKQQSIPSEHPLANEPFVLRSIQSTGLNPMGHPMPTQEQLQGMLGRGKFGKAAVDEYAKSLDIQTKQEGLGLKHIPFDDVQTTFLAANEQGIGDKLIADSKKAGLSYVPQGKLDLALKGLGVKNAGMRGSAIDTIAETRRLALRDSLIKEARTSLDPMFQTGAGRDQMNRLLSIGRGQTLANQMLTQEGGGDPQQLTEMATALDRVIRGGGVSAQQQIEHLFPKTSGVTLANWKQWWTNNPQGALQQDFTKRTLETLKREQGVITGQVRASAERTAPTLRVLKSEYPEDYKAVVDQYLNHSPEIMGLPTGQTTPTKIGRFTVEVH
jgi:hypothetical protein